MSLDAYSMLDLFRMELETQTVALSNGVLLLEKNPGDKPLLESLMRSAHSIKGAARIADVEPLVHVAHALEECFVAAQKGQTVLGNAHIDQFLQITDLMTQCYQKEASALPAWLAEQCVTFERGEKKLRELLTGCIAPSEKKETPTVVAPIVQGDKERMLRMTTTSMNRLMGLAGEMLVESKWLQPLLETMRQMKHDQQLLGAELDRLRDQLVRENISEHAERYLKESQHKVNHSHEEFTTYVADMELFLRRYTSLSDRLYQEVIHSRMQPFGDGTLAFPRMMRDVAKELNKKVRLEIAGKKTPVDRDILQGLEAPLGHMLRNAIDHGIESAEERAKAGKPEEGEIRLEAHHRGGGLVITVSDDGGGINLEKIRARVIEMKLSTPSLAAGFSESELLDFLCLPGFSTASEVTEISGRGVGLNIVQKMVQEVSGSLKISFKPGLGTTIELHLPLTLSVIRALLVEISGEPYAFPLAQIDRTFLIDEEEIRLIENRQFIAVGDHNIGLISANQLFGRPKAETLVDELPIVVISDHTSSYGIVVDRFLGERELVIHELDPILGKTPNINKGSFMENGAPLLIIDVQDMLRSADTLLAGESLQKLPQKEKVQAKKTKRVLIVEDSITVREVESRLLKNRGYDVDIAINGVDGWNALRLNDYDLVITDVDMPRMNGIELVRTIKNDPKLKMLPVMIVSYKAREEDRQLGLAAGANCYLTKGSFQDEALLNAVKELIGDP